MLRSLPVSTSSLSGHNTERIEGTHAAHLLAVANIPVFRRSEEDVYTQVDSFEDERLLTAGVGRILTLQKCCGAFCSVLCVIGVCVCVCVVQYAMLGP